MYLPPHFATDDPEALHQLMQAHPLGALITHGSQGLDANHLPFEFAKETGGQGVLRAHVARNNPLWQEAKDGDEVLVIYKAADAYISPSWYPSKHDHHKQVPTWNYSVVHADGRISIRDDARFIRRLLANLTRTHEAGEPSLVGKFKLGQNKDEADRQGAAHALHARGLVEVACDMENPPSPRP